VHTWLRIVNPSLAMLVRRSCRHRISNEGTDVLWLLIPDRALEIGWVFFMHGSEAFLSVTPFGTDLLKG